MTLYKNRFFYKSILPAASVILFFLMTVALFNYAKAESVSVPVISKDMKDTTPLAEGMEGRLSLDLRNIDVVDALKFLSMKARVNIIATKNVTGRITLMVEDVRVQDVFDIMLRSNGLAYTKESDIYNVMTEDEYKELFGKKFSDIRQVKTFKLRYAIPEQAFSVLDALKSDIGRVLVEPDSGTALVMDTPDKIKDIDGAIAALEEKNMVEVFNLKYAKAKDIEEQLKLQLDSKKVGTVKADERSNQVIVQALPERMAQVKKIIEALDSKTKEVLIDTKIIKVKLSDAMESGVQWEGLVNLGKRFGMTYMGSYPFSPIQATTSAFRTRSQVYDALQNDIGSYPSSGLTTPATAGSVVSPGEEIHVGIVDKDLDLDAVVKYLQSLENTQILSNPKIAVINNQEARIHVGERQAYVTTTTTTGQTTTTVSEEVTFVDVGIQMAVTPTINDDGYVTMKIKPEVSSVTSTLTTPSGNKIPIIDTSMAETTVMVKDGSTIIIGGLRKEEKTKESEGVPFLSKIPILGFLFKNKSEGVERTELLVMITPHIVSGDILTTGDERDFRYLPGKDYKDYKDFTQETDLKHPDAALEEKIKPYKEYSNERE
ncbi:MAG: hypothetical protein JW946_04925 [Candidatus Omnitrophica bacterium]|nr:hypothetical protein [Candidatus Omnitrophota bacterium]